MQRRTSSPLAFWVRGCENSRLAFFILLMAVIVLQCPKLAAELDASISQSLHIQKEVSA